MADISKITLPSGNTYDIKDAYARQLLAAGLNFVICWDGTAAPVVANIPAGVVVTYNSTDYTGTKAASTAEPLTFYLVKSTTQVGGDYYDEYVSVRTGGSGTEPDPYIYAWEKLGDTKVDISITLNKGNGDIVLGEATTFTNSSSAVTFSGGTTDKVLGEATTFALTSGSVTHGALTGHTDTVLGTGTGFTVTEPTISVTPSTTNIKATASGTAVGADGTDTFVKSYPGATSKLVTTTVPNVTGHTDKTLIFSMSDANTNNGETLIISGSGFGTGTAANTYTADKVSVGTAITVATGSLDANGGGSSVMTGLGTASTGSALTGVKVTTQPTVNLTTGATAGTGVVSVATGISSASASGTAVSADATDQVTAIISMPTSTVGTGITVGTNDNVTAITGIGTGTAAAQTITVGTNDKIKIAKYDDLSISTS